MAYRIQYGQSLQRELINDKPKFRKGLLVSRWIAAAAILLVMALLSKTGQLDFLIPGDTNVTKQAFASMVEDVGAGTGVDVAFTAFCREILNGAQSPY